MNFEFVEFYPLADINKKNSKQEILGTCHIYCVESEMDIRGIRISRKKDNFYFIMPQLFSVDELGNKIMYPIISWTNPNVFKELMTYLQKEVKPKIKEFLFLNKD